MDKAICGAKSRSNYGLPCKLSPMENGRCRFHGGKTPIKHGRYSKKIISEKKRFKEFMLNYVKDLSEFLIN
jgi:hypothetical protein